MSETTPKQDKDYAIPMNDMTLIWQLVGSYLAGNGGNLAYAFDEVVSEYAALRLQFRASGKREFIARKRQGTIEFGEASVKVKWQELHITPDQS